YFFIVPAVRSCHDFPNYFTARLAARRCSARTISAPFHRSPRGATPLSSHGHAPFHRSPRGATPLTSHDFPNYFTARLAARRCSPRTAIMPGGARQHHRGCGRDRRHEPGTRAARRHAAAEARHPHGLGTGEGDARHEDRAEGDENREDPREVATRKHPALEPGARSREDPGTPDRDERARAEPDEERAAHREHGELEVERGDPVDDAVGEVREGGLPELPLARAHGPDGRKRPPHFARTSASSSRVMTVSPRPRAYASTAFTTMPRANDGIAASRSRAPSS